MLNEWKQCKGAQGRVGTGSVLCSEWRYWYLQPVGRAARQHHWQRSICPFVHLTQQHSALFEQFCWKEGKKQSPSCSWCLSLPLPHSCCCHGSSRRCWRMLWRASSSLPAVPTAPGASGCSHGGVGGRFLHCLPWGALGLPSPGSLCSGMALLLTIGSTAQQQHNGLLLLHQAQSYCPTSWSNPVRVIAKHILALSMYKSILQGASVSLSLSAAENKFSIPVGVTMLKCACLCPFLCLHQTVGVSKGCTLNSPSSSSRLHWLFPVWIAKLYYWIWEPWQLSNRHIQEMFWSRLVCRIQSMWDGWILWTSQPMPCLMLNRAKQSVLRLFLQFTSNFSHFFSLLF